MTHSFSGNEIIEMAIQIEKKGFDFYTGMKNRTKDDDLKNLYSWLATEEGKHIDVFEKMRSYVENLKLSRPYDLQEVMMYFRALIETKVFPDSQEGSSLLNELRDEIGAIQIAISFEKDSILFFQEMNNLVDDREKEIIDKLIVEEKGHIFKLLKMKQDITSTRN